MASVTTNMTGRMGVRTEDSKPAWRDSLLHLRDAVDQLAAAELPRGFGRD